ncbi:MAG TPA: hypothetical protein P5255_09515 [Phycisphaerae bacterium]|nr:hypothetical protein [Phycisphaerae bacterium]HRT42293.1 hypothetical protein [Phycisphaerae bacterium]
MTWLRQGTEVTVKLGPFVDAADGATAETALSIDQADIRLSKAGGAFDETHVEDGAAHDEAGWYDVTLDADDTDTLGELVVSVQVAGALPVWERYTVVPAEVYDAVIGGTGLHVYWAEIELRLDEDGGMDRWSVLWYRDGVLLTTGVSDAALTVQRATTGAPLLNGVSLTDIGGGHLLYSEDTDRIDLGTPYIATVSATIDGATRTWSKPIGRDV